MVTQRWRQRDPVQPISPIAVIEYDYVDTKLDKTEKKYLIFVNLLSFFCRQTGYRKGEKEEVVFRSMSTVVGPVVRLCATVDAPVVHE